VLIEKPLCGDFLPILDGGFSLQYSPLLEYREGNGMVLFCQMDVTGRTATDPAAELQRVTPLGIKAAVTGLDLDGRPFATAHSISTREALVAYTRTAAEMLDLPSGILAPGRAGDLVVLDRSPLEIDWTREMPMIDATIVAGRTTYDRASILPNF
jgi:predicted amidohydrolase YtcJ